MEDLSSAVAASFANQLVTDGVASTLQARVPLATFVRLSLRCGSGLFVTGDLLRPGPLAVSIVSLYTSMAGLAMKQGAPVCLDVDPSMSQRWQREGTQLLVCYPVAVRAALGDGAHGSSQAEGATTQIGAVLLGLAAPAPVELQLRSDLEAFCASLGPYLLLVSLTKLQDMAATMRLPVAECACCSAEEEEVDAPLGRCMDGAGPSGPPGDAAPAQTAANRAARKRGGGGGGGGGEDRGRASTSGPPTPRRSASLDGGESSSGSKEGLRNRGGSGREGGGGGAKAPLLEFEELAPATGGKGATAAGGAALHHHQEEEEEEDPKAAAKRRAGALAAPGALRQGVLLNFLDPALEARFRRVQARSVLKLDVLFHLVYLVAFACTAALDPPSVLRAPASVWLLWLVGMPALTMITATEWYVRWRQWLLIPLTLLHVAHYRFVAAPALLRSVPSTALLKMPWLLRCSGGEALLVFPVGSKLPFSLFLPIQLASVLLMLTMLPGPCQALSPLLGGSLSCLPAGWGARCGAALLGAGFVLPTCAIYFAESRARRHFGRVLQSLQHA